MSTQNSHELKQYSQKELYILEDRLLPLAEYFFRFAYALNLDRDRSLVILKESLMQAIKPLAAIDEFDEGYAYQVVFRYIYEPSKLEANTSTASPKALERFLGGLTKEQCACFVCYNYFGLSMDQIEQIVNLPIEAIRRMLSESYLSLLRAYGVEDHGDDLDVGDQEFLFAYLNEYLADTLTSEDKSRYIQLLKNEQVMSLIEAAKQSKGQFQIDLNELRLEEHEFIALRDGLEDPELRVTREVQKIDEIRRWEAFSDVRRRVLVILAVVVGVLFIYYKFSPRKKQDIDILAALNYEALAMHESALVSPEASYDARVDFPSTDIDELATFVEAVKDLNFTPVILEKYPSGWQPRGVSVIDYDGFKVIAIQFQKKIYVKDQQQESPQYEYFYYFNLAGDLTDLPMATTGILPTKPGFEYRVYGNEVFNFVVWRTGEDSLGVLVGQMDSKNLALIAANQ